MGKKDDARLEELTAKGGGITAEELDELNALRAAAGLDAIDSMAPSPSFDKEGATSVVTLRDGPKRVWFRDGKEIGVEDAG